MRLTPALRRRPRARRHLGIRSAASAAAFALILGVMSAVSSTPPAQAAELPANISDGGYIISDKEFFDASAMTASAAQKFLEARVPTCKATTGPTCLRNFTADLPAKAKDAYCAAIPAKKKVKASEIVVTVGKACGINPQVILVMLQKEQGLVTSTKPSDWSYRASMGMNCPDTAPCSAASAGFVNQVYLGARQQQVYAKNPTRYGYQAGRVNTIKWHPNSSCGSSKVFIKNQATANLYIYTPYRPNIAALAAGYATGDGCSSYGNRNFYNYYVQWFEPSAVGGKAGAPAAVAACTAPAKADVVAASGTATVVAAVAARKAPVAACSSGAKSLAKDASVSVRGVYGAWVQIASGTTTLWAPKSSLRMPGSAPAAGSDACKVPAESSVTKATGTVVVTTASLNARKAPTTSCETGKRSILKDETYERTGTHGDWWRLSVAGSTYWAHSDYLELQKATPKTRWTKDAVHLRTTAGGSALVSTLLTGTEVTTSDIDGAWTRVTAGSLTGWIDSKRLLTSKPTAPKTTHMQTAAAVTMRIALTGTSRAVGTAAKGARVTVVDTSGSWRAITSGGATGWVLATALTAVAPPAPKPMFATDVVHLRPQKSQTGVVATARRGEQILLTSTQGGWSQVSLGGSTGWVDAKRLVATKPATPKTSAAAAASAVTVRVGASDSSKSAGSLAKGAKVTVVDTFQSWRAIASGSLSGWVPASSLTTAATTRTMYTTSAVHLRPQASSRGVTSTLLTGTQVSVTRISGSWSQVKAGSVVGWVDTKRLSAKRPAVPAPVAAAATATTTLRAGLSGTTKAVGAMPKGSKVTIVDRAGSWRAVTFGSKTGWVLASLVKPAPAASTGKAMKTTAALNLRTAPSTSATRIVTLGKGATVTIISSQGEWRQVKAGSRTGWVHGSYLR